EALKNITDVVHDVRSKGRSFPFRNGDERAPAAPVLFPRLLWLWPVRNHITFPVIILFFFLL
ncbi:hypothetical protein, partial [Escherichia coli]|uniref:hypothetical protein n=1 Tax=Escherichia coli TaxID=562 RepID=UPI001BD39EDF